MKLEEELHPPCESLNINVKHHGKSLRYVVVWVRQHFTISDYKLKQSVSESIVISLTLTGDIEPRLRSISMQSTSLKKVRHLSV